MTSFKPNPSLTKRKIKQLLKLNAGNKSAIARALGVSRPTLYRLLREHKLNGAKP